MVQQGEIQLAIVIPAFKGKYLSRTLDALAGQTQKTFNVYIGDDGSPDNIENVITAYKSTLSIKFKKYAENLGKKSLVKHWHRCIELIENEPWIWLLPDDDVPDNNCVESFLTCRKSKPGYNLYRFLTIHIDEHDKEIKKNQIPPEIESGYEFIINKLKYIRNSSVAEYIFSRKSYENAGGFEDIPLAWGSDDLMWFKLSHPSGIYTIFESKVSLRQTSNNISSDINALKYVKTESIYRVLVKIYQQKEFKAYLLEKNQYSDFEKTCQQYIFNNYKSYKIRFNVFRIVKYAKYNNLLIGGGYLKNIYRLIIFIYKRYFISN